MRCGVMLAVALEDGTVASKAAEISSPCGPRILPTIVSPSCVVSAVAGLPASSLIAHACISPMRIKGRTWGSVLEIRDSIKGEEPVHPANPSFQLNSSAIPMVVDASSIPTTEITLPVLWVRIVRPSVQTCLGERGLENGRRMEIPFDEKRSAEVFTLSFISRYISLYRSLLIR